MVLHCGENRRDGSRKASIEVNLPILANDWLALFDQIQAKAQSLEAWVITAVEGAVRGGCPHDCKFLSGGWTYKVDVQPSFQPSSSPPLRGVLRVDFTANWRAAIFCAKKLEVDIPPGQLGLLRIEPLAEYPWDDFQSKYGS